MLILDTDSLAPAERAEAFQDAVSQNCTKSMSSFDDPIGVRAELHVFDLGPAKVFNIEATGNTLRRTPSMARAMNDCPIALALPMRTDNHMMWEREERLFGPQDMILVDLSAPYVYGWNGDGASYAFHVEFDQLDLPMDTIRTATRQLHTSPIYPLVRDHIARVTAEAHLVVESGSAAAVGAASVDLMHALIVSAAGDERRLDEVMHTSPGALLDAYVSRHIRDPDLTPARIAAANGLSLRSLYAAYERRGISLEQSMIEQRLAGTRADLAAPQQRHRSISAIAASWGFDNPSFFSTRFRQAFGVTPRQWRAAAHATTSPGTARTADTVQVIADALRRTGVTEAI